MATSPVQKQLYPLTTGDGVPIPLEIIRAEALLRVAIGANAHEEFTIPTDWETISIWADKDCVVHKGNTATYPVPVESVMYDALFVEAGTTTSVYLEAGVYRVVPLRAAESGILMLNKFTRWAGLAQKVQVVRR